MTYVHQNQIRTIVRALNKAFCKSHWFKGEKIYPFKGVLVEERGWLIVCNDFYIWDDDLRFKQIKRLTTVFEYPFQFEFEGRKTMTLTKKMFVK